jgi:hypothetical protein
MARCDVCGNEYDKAFQVYCCASCARHSGVKSLRDRATEAA